MTPIESCQQPLANMLLLCRSKLNADELHIN